MKKKSLIALLLTLVLALSLLSGCASKAGTADGSPAEKLRTVTGNNKINSISYPLVGQVNSLDPEYFLRVYESQVIYQIYEPVFYLDNESNVINALAEAVTADEIGSKVEITLKSGIKFQNGEELTANDVAYTLNRSKNSNVCSDLYAYSSIEVIDDLHLVWNFPEAENGAGYNELISSVAAMPVVCQSYCEGLLSAPEDNLNLNANGTGPYVLDVVASNGDITLKKNPEYHGTVSIDTINFKVITGNLPIAFESGDIDLCDYDSVAYELVKQYTNVDTEIVVTNNVSFIMNNCAEQSPMKDKRIREASVRALNREDAAMMMSDGSALLAYNMATPLVDFYADVCDHYDMDLEASKKLMTEAGYSDTNRCAIDLITISRPAWVACCEIIKENLEQSYFTVTIEELADPTRYYTGEFDMALMSIGLNNSFTSYSVLFDDNSGLNMAFITGAERDEVLEKVLKSSDEASAHEAMKAVVDTLAYVPLTYNASPFAYDANLNHGIFYTSLGSFLFREFSWKS